MAVGISKLLGAKGPTFGREVGILVKRQEVAVKGRRIVGPYVCVYIYTGYNGHGQEVRRLQ